MGLPDPAVDRRTDQGRQTQPSQGGSMSQCRTEGPPGRLLTRRGFAMYRLFVLAGLLVLAVVVSGAVEAQDKSTKDKPKSIGEIMKKAHAGDGALKTAVTKAVKAK